MTARQPRDGFVPRVLMVTGVYYPDISGASLQCRALIAAFGDRARCRVLTTTNTATLLSQTAVDGVPVDRVRVDLTRPWTKMTAALAMALVFLREARRVQLLHLHGFSQKSALLMLLARATGTPVVVKMSSLGHDDPVSLARRHPWLYRLYARADRLISIGPAFASRFHDAGLSPGRLASIPNGVDLARFAPATVQQRLAARRDLGLPPDTPAILCVAFFSAEKQQEALFEAWVDSRATSGDSLLVFAGARGGHAEADPSIADRIAARAHALGLDAHVFFIDQRLDVERVYQAADVFVLPSTREGAPNAVIEAMASGLPCIVSHLPGVTDALIDDRRDGILVDAGDRRALAEAIAAVVCDRTLAARLGSSARETAARRFGIDRVANDYLTMYRTLLCAE